MENNMPRHNYPKILPASIVAAACIVAAGLVSSAKILAGRPVPGEIAISPVRSVPTLPAPPLSQETIHKQVRDQILAAPNLQTYAYDGHVYKLVDVKVSEVSYLPKDDIFTAIVEWQWQQAMPESGPRKESVTLSNNGYNQYTGGVFMRSNGNSNIQYADICVK
jgi:hypothetical protein